MYLTISYLMYLPVVHRPHRHGAGRESRASFDVASISLVPYNGRREREESVAGETSNENVCGNKHGPGCDLA